MNCRVFTYWEGKPYAFTQLCIDSIRRVFGTRHVHLTPENIPTWIDLPEDIRNCNHISFRSDFIRTLLLQRHGGWWFDCDVLLCRDPSELIDDEVPQIWNLIYRVRDQWVPLVNNGILFSPARSEWIERIAHDFISVDRTALQELTWANEDIGQLIYERHSTGGGQAVRIGHEHDFNSTVNVDADFAPFWDGRIALGSARYGIHIGASLSRWAALAGSDTAKRTLNITSLDELVHAFPRSLIAEYFLVYGDQRSLPQLDISTSVVCAVRCAYCPQGEDQPALAGNRHMTLEAFILALTKVPTGVQINFSGYAEPFLNRYCTDMILHAHQRGHRVSVYTTLVGISLDNIARLRTVPFVTFDIHLPSKRGRERIRVDSSYIGRLRAALSQLTNAVPVIIDWNGPDNGVSELDEVFSGILIVHERANSRAGSLKAGDITPPRHPGQIACDRGLHSPVLLPDGQVTICCQDFRAQHVIGNLLTDSYLSLFGSSEFQRVMQGLNNPKSDTLCRLCEYAIVVYD